MRTKILYVVAESFGGLIESAAIYTNKKRAITRACSIWREARHDRDDVKVITNGTEVVWGPGSPHVVDTI